MQVIWIGRPAQRQKCRAMDQVSQSCDDYDLTISTKKTEVVHQPAPETIL